MTVEYFLAAPAAEAGAMAAPPPGGEHTLTLDAGSIDAPVGQEESSACAELRCSVGFDNPLPLTLTF